MTDWNQIEHAEIRKLVSSSSALKSALEKFCMERAVKARSESGSALLASPRDVEKAVTAAVEADVFQRFLRRLETEVNSFERAAAALLSSAEPTREEEQFSE